MERVTEPHQHRFPLRTRWHQDRRSGMYYQTIVGHDDCECGLSWTRHLVEQSRDPLRRWALAYIRRRYHTNPWYR